MILTKPTPFDCTELLANLRPGDAAEVQATGWNPTGEDLWRETEKAYEAYTVRKEGELVCVFGVGYVGEVGVPWLLGTVLLDEFLLTLCKYAPYILDRWQEQFPLLTNATDKRNTKILRWLKWLGFELGAEIPVGPDKQPFIVFSRSAPCANPQPF